MNTLAPAIETLVPHQGSMCLLEKVLAWDETSATCQASSHHRPDNPLRMDEHLPAFAGIEYAAQAMAAHSSLTGKASGRSARGYLVSVRDVQIEGERLDAIDAALTVQVHRVSSDAGHLMYDFCVALGERKVVWGSATVIVLRRDT